MVTLKKKFPRLSDGHIDLETWIANIEVTYSLNTFDLIKKCVTLSNTACLGLTTFYGQPCIEQSLEMAEIILDLRLDQEAVAASLLISAVQHTKLSIDIIKHHIGENVAKLVAGEQQMNILNSVKTNIKKSRDATQIDRLRKVVLAMVSDIRVVLIKLAEQTTILRGIKNINPLEKKRIAQETLDVYAPLANRLGIGQLKWELEDLAFHYINPDTYKMIAKFLAERRIDRENRIHEVIATLKKNLITHHINANISGRAKHIYSIYLKMQKKHMDYKNIYDASAVRVLVDTVDDCYNALSIVNHLWEHIPAEFDDYIANPKSNGYRSIHTAVVGPEGKNLEIQIRTHDMHDEAEHGVAAHWLYKEKTAQTGYEAKITFLRQLLAWHKEFASEDDKPNQATDRLEDRVYVFTPNSDIVDLPKGATPIDFAYHIHTSLGHRCRGAKINGHIVPLTYTLQTGDRVDIITTQHGTPSRDWLHKEFGFISTARARAKISQFFRQLDVNQYIESGRNILEREFAKAGIHQIDLQKIAVRFNFKNVDAMLISLGHGSLRPSQITHAIQAEQHETAKPLLSLPKKPLPKSSLVQIPGIDDLLTRIAKCCKPIPGDAIMGYITQGRGVSIHRADCVNIVNLQANNHNRLMPISWDSQQLGMFFVDIQIRAAAHDDLLKEITSTLSNIKINLISMRSTINKKNNIFFIFLTIQIKEIAELNVLIHHLSQLPNVYEVKRIK